MKSMRNGNGKQVADLKILWSDEDNLVGKPTFQSFVELTGLCLLTRFYVEYVDQACSLNKLLDKWNRSIK